jgi:hypothetical protein
MTDGQRELCQPMSLIQILNLVGPVLTGILSEMADVVALRVSSSAASTTTLWISR